VLSAPNLALVSAGHGFHQPQYLDHPSGKVATYTNLRRVHFVRDQTIWVGCRLQRAQRLGLFSLQQKSTYKEVTMLKSLGPTSPRVFGSQFSEEYGNVCFKRNLVPFPCRPFTSWRHRNMFGGADRH
jgi:hypothetical protein